MVNILFISNGYYTNIPKTNINYINRYTNMYNYLNFLQSFWLLQLIIKMFSIQM